MSTAARRHREKSESKAAEMKEVKKKTKIQTEKQQQKEQPANNNNVECAMRNVTVTVETVKNTGRRERARSFAQSQRAPFNNRMF